MITSLQITNAALIEAGKRFPTTVEGVNQRLDFMCGFEAGARFMLEENKAAKLKIDKAMKDIDALIKQIKILKPE